MRCERAERGQGRQSSSASLPCPPVRPTGPACHCRPSHTGVGVNNGAGGQARHGEGQTGGMWGQGGIREPTNPGGGKGKGGGRCWRLGKVGLGVCSRWWGGEQVLGTHASWGTGWERGKGVGVAWGTGGAGEGKCWELGEGKVGNWQVGVGSGGRWEMASKMQNEQHTGTHAKMHKRKSHVQPT